MVAEGREHGRNSSTKVCHTYTCAPPAPRPILAKTGCMCKASAPSPSWEVGVKTSSKMGLLLLLLSHFSRVRLCATP